MESVSSAKFMAASPPVPAPKPPEITGVSYARLIATVDVLMSKTDVDNQPLTAPLSNTKIIVTATGYPNIVKDFPGKFTPGQEYKFEVEVPAWKTDFGYEAKVTP